MLINATHPDEVRVAVLDGAVLENYQTEVAEQGLTRGNIYRGVISNIQPSLNAAFIDYGAEKNGFLAIQDVVPEAYYRAPKNPKRPAIDEVLEQGMPVVVQVQKEAEGQKGSSVTTNLSLAGRYLVLTPFDTTRGVSRKVEDDDTRKKLRQAASSLDVPEGSGFIVRTNALDQNKAALARDLATLVRLWRRIEEEAVRPAPRGQEKRLLYNDQDLLLRALRDHLDASMDEILVDTDAAYEKAEQYMHAFLPRSKTQLLRYAERAPLFERFDVEHQIDRIFERTANLPSGGYVVIDRTEALTAIDVNSGKSTRGATQADTALQTNLEAAREVARQLRLRDIGGLVVVDFIDMRASKSQRRLEKELKDAMKDDRARFTVGRISPNGLLEINRQRIQQSLDRRAQTHCSVCEGTGRVPALETVFQQLLRRIEARAAVAPIRGVRLSLHPDVAEAFRSSRRGDIGELERQFDLKVEIVPTRRVAEHAQEFEWLDRDRSMPGPAPVWTVTTLADEVRWRAPLVPSAGDLPLAATAAVRFSDEPIAVGRRDRGGEARRGGRSEKAPAGRGERMARPERGGRRGGKRGRGGRGPGRDRQDPAVLDAVPAPADGGIVERTVGEVAGRPAEGAESKRRRRRGGRRRNGRREETNGANVLPSGESRPEPESGPPSES
jgi:ribonuclease E